MFSFLAVIFRSFNQLLGPSELLTKAWQLLESASRKWKAPFSTCFLPCCRQITSQGHSARWRSSSKVGDVGAVNALFRWRHYCGEQARRDLDRTDPWPAPVSQAYGASVHLKERYCSSLLYNQLDYCKPFNIDLLYTFSGLWLPYPLVWAAVSPSPAA